MTRIQQIETDDRKLISNAFITKSRDVTLGKALAQEGCHRHLRSEISNRICSRGEGGKFRSESNERH